MDLSLRRRLAVKESLILALGLVLVLALLSFVGLGVLVVLFDPPLHQRIVLRVISAIVILPTAATLGAMLYHAARMRPDHFCVTCKKSYADCTCCPRCRGTGKTPYDERSTNWLLPDACPACGGSGTERPGWKYGDTFHGFEGPPRRCSFCAETRPGRPVSVYRLYYSDRPTVHEWKQARPESVFMCHECGRGCSSEREAEDRAARRKTDGQEAIARDPFRLRSPAEFQEELRMPGGAKIVYWGATKWREALAAQERKSAR